MLGLGENTLELCEAFDDLRSYEVDVLTLGQYLRPSLQHLPVERFVSPEEFQELEQLSRQKQFLYVAAGPMVRSSYKAAEFFMEGVIRKGKDHGGSAHLSKQQSEHQSEHQSEKEISADGF